MTADPNTLTLENEYLSLRVLPARGGKLSSFVDRATGFELLFQPPKGYPPLAPDMDFSKGDASGLDDVFPSMGEVYAGPLTDTVYFLPDHGEIWTSEMAVESASPEEVTLRCEGRLLPYLYKKRFRLSGRRVDMEIAIRNTGREKLPLVWVSHGLLRLESDTRFEFPADARYVECMPGYPEKDSAVCSVDGPRYRFHEPVPEGAMMKFYFAEPVREGRCRALYPSHSIAAEMTFDTRALPYLGFWITNGGYRGDRCFAFEPATAYYDTWQCAFANARLPLLSPGSEATLSLSLSLSPLDPQEETPCATPST